MATINGTFRLDRGLGIDNVFITVGEDVPYGASSGFTSTEFNDMELGSLYINKSTGTQYRKKSDVNSNINDFELVGQSANLTGLKAFVNYIADEAGDSTAFSSWESGSPTADDTFLNTTDGKMYVGDGTTTAVEFKTDVELDGLRIATKDANTIYLGATGGNLSADPTDGTLSVNDTFICKNDETQPTGAIFQWNGSANIYISDADWAYATGIVLSSGYTAAGTWTAPSPDDTVEEAISKLHQGKLDHDEATGIGISDSYTEDTSEDNITTADTVESAIEKLEGKLSNERETLSQVTLTSSTNTAIDTITIGTGEKHAYEWDVIVTKDGDSQIGSLKVSAVVAEDSGSLNIDFDRYSIKRDLLDLIPRITVADNSGDLELRCRLLTYSSGTYYVDIIRRLIYKV